MPSEESAEISGPEPKEVSLLGVFSVLASAVVLLAALAPNFIRARAQGELTACTSSLKNMATAMEMYSTDWGGQYPSSRALLTPNYLKTLPNCPSTGSVTYVTLRGPSAPYNTMSEESYYFIYCKGENHLPISIPANYPQYTGIVGLIER